MRKNLTLRKLWLSLLLLVGATAIPGIQEIAAADLEIGTVDQLKAFRDAVNSGNTYARATVVLTADLDLSSESNWTPIGNLVAYPSQSFNGTFDGNGHSISNVTVNDNTPNHAVAGLFGSVVNGTIKNLTVRNVNLTNTHYAGGIVAYTSNGPTIENCKVIGGTIKSTPEIVNGSYDNGDKVGGIMGYATAGSTINNCWVEGVTLSAYRDLGGIVGFSAGTVTNNTAKNVTVTQDLTNGYKNPAPTTIGDIIGRDGGATLSNNTVIKSDPVAQIGETKFETLQDAFDAANDGDVVELLKDYDASAENNGNYPGSTNRNLWLAKGVTVDGNGYTLTVTNRGIGVQGASDNIDVVFKDITIKNSSASGRCIDTRGKIGSLTLDNATLSTEGKEASQPLTIGGNQADAATVKILNGSTVATSEDGKYGYAVTTFNPVNMTVDGSTLKGWACFNIKAASSSAGSNGSVFNITNSELTSKNIYSGSSNAYSVFKIEDVDVTINVTNTTINVDGASNREAIVGFQPGNTNGSIVNLGEGNNVVFTGTTDFAHNDNAASKLVISGGIFNQPVPEQNCAEGMIPADLGDGKYSVKVGSYVAQIEGGAKYETLEAAFAAAADGNTVTLLKDVSLTDRLFVNAGAEPAYAGSNNRYATTSENKSITLDLSGYNVTTSSNIALAGGSLNIVNSGTADADHGVISTTNDGLAPIEIRGTGDLAQKRTLTVGTGVTLSGAEYGLNIFGSNDEQKNVIDVNVNGTVNGTLFVLGNLKNAENEININVAGTVYVPDNGDDKANVGVALNGIATVNVNEGAQVSGETGIEVRAGNLVVNGGNITATASTYSEKKNGSGSCTKGAAVAVAQHTTKLPITATLNGGTLTGTKTLAVTDVEEIGLNDVTVKAADALANAETVIIPEGYKWLSNGTMSTLTPCDYVAQVGETKYETLADAFSAAADGNTVTLLKDVALTDRLFVNAGAEPAYAGSNNRYATTSENKSITLDLNGYNVTTSSNIALAGGSLNIVNNGTADADHGVISTSGSGLAPIEIRGTGDLASKRTLTIGENVTLKGADYGLNVFGSNDAQKNVIEVNVNGTVDGVLFVLGNLSNAENDIVINANGKITSTTDAGIALNGNAKVNVADGAEITGLSGIEVRAGELNVNGGTITATAEEYSYTANGSGTTVKGAAIAVSQHGTLLPTTANVNGGTLAGAKTVAVVAHEQNAGLENVTVVAKDELVAENTEIPEGFKWVSSEGMSTLTPCIYVAQIEGGAKYESLAEAVAAVPADGTETTITMIADEAVVAGVTIAANQNVVLELNGKTVSGNTDSSKTYALITNKGTLVIQDNTDTNLDGTGTGLITTYISNPDGGDVPGYASNTITNNGNLTVKSGKIVNNGAGYACFAIDNQTNGNLYNPILIIDGGRMQQMNEYTYAVRMFANSTTNVNTCEVNGGVIEGGYGLWLQTPNTKANKADLKITGGIINANDGAALYIGGTKADNSNISIDIAGGQINGTGVIIQGPQSGTYGHVSISDGEFVNIQCGANVEKFISGGIFKEQINDAFIAEGYIPTANTDPETKEAYPYTVKTGAYVAQIGEGEDAVKYESLADAVDAVKDGETILMIADVPNAGGMTVSSGKNFTVDFDGHTYTLNKPGAGSTGTETSGFQLLMNSTIVFKNGTINISEDNLTEAVDPAKNIMRVIQNYANLTLENMTVDGTNQYGGNTYVVSFNNGNVVIDGSTITAGENPVSPIFDVCRYSSYPSVNVTVKGESVINGDIEVYAGGGDPKEGMFLTVEGGTINGNLTLTEGGAAAITNNTEKAAVTKSDDVTLAAPEGFKWVSNGDGTSSLAPRDAVAQIGETKYYSLADAVAAVPTDGTQTTIEMIANEMINVVGSAITIPTNKNVVIDLNGFQVVGTAEGGSTSALITNKGKLTIKDSSDTNKDGTGTGQLISGATTTWIYEGDGNYAGSYASNTITNSGTLTIESGYIENLSTGSATYAVDNNSSGGDAILNMNGGLLKARSVAVRQFANSTTLKNEVNVAGGTVTAGYSGIWIQLPGSDATKAMKASLNVTGGTLTGGSYAFYDYSYGNSFDATQYNLSGGTFNGYVFSYGANINITDGTYNGDVAIKQAKPSIVAVSGGKFGDDVYTYGDNASEGFITGGVYASTTYEYEGETYDCDWLNMLADGYVVSDNTDPETKDAYPYAVINPSETELVLVHGEPYPVMQTATYKKVTYLRTFEDRRIGKYQCWFVPFDYTISGTEDATFYKIHMISASEEENVEDNTLVYIFIEKMNTGDVLYANKPYVIKPNQNDYEFVVENGPTLYKPTTESRLRLATAEFYYDFYGTFDYFKATKPLDWMTLKYNGSIVWNATSNAELVSYNWYIRMTGNEENANYSKVNFMFVEDSISESGITTSVESVGVDMDGIEGIYTPNGIKINKPSKGLNIIKYKNGSTKKIYIK